MTPCSGSTPDASMMRCNAHADILGRRKKVFISSHLFGTQSSVPQTPHHELNACSGHASCISWRKLVVCSAIFPFI